MLQLEEIIIIYLTISCLTWKLILKKYLHKHCFSKHFTFTHVVICFFTVQFIFAFYPCWFFQVLHLQLWVPLVNPMKGKRAPCFLDTPYLVYELLPCYHPCSRRHNLSFSWFRFILFCKSSPPPKRSIQWEPICKWSFLWMANWTNASPWSEPIRKLWHVADFGASQTQTISLYFITLWCLGKRPDISSFNFLICEMDP